MKCKLVHMNALDGNKINFDNIPYSMTQSPFKECFEKNQPINVQNWEPFFEIRACISKWINEFNEIGQRTSSYSKECSEKHKYNSEIDLYSDLTSQERASYGKYMKCFLIKLGLFKNGAFTQH